MLLRLKNAPDLGASGNSQEPRLPIFCFSVLSSSSPLLLLFLYFSSSSPLSSSLHSFLFFSPPLLLRSIFLHLIHTFIREVTRICISSNKMGPNLQVQPPHLGQETPHLCPPIAFQFVLLLFQTDLSPQPSTSPTPPPSPLSPSTPPRTQSHSSWPARAPL